MVEPGTTAIARTDDLALTEVAANTGATPGDDWIRVGDPMPGPAQPELLDPGTPAPDFELETADGRTVKLTDLRGQVVVLDFWATWCGPCRQALPTIQKLNLKFAGKPVRVFGISVFEGDAGFPDRADPAAIFRREGCTYELLLRGDAVAALYHVTSIPVVYVVGTDGKVLSVHEGFQKDLDESLARTISAALPSR